MTYDEFQAEWTDGNDYIRCQTSGSTGCPKRIMLPKLELRKSAMRTIKFLDLPTGAHFHSCISPDFIGGKMMLVRKELTEGTLSWETPSNRPLADYSGPEIDLLAVVPSQMIFILDNAGRMPEINNILVGGSSIPPALRQRIADSGLNAYETYGMTETASHIALRRISVPQTPFRLLEGIDIAATKDSRLSITIQGWQELETNDIVTIDGDGNFEILGRADNVIITGGKKVHPEHVEQVLEGLLNEEIMITGIPDGKWGQRVVMLISADAEYLKTHTKDDIICLCRRNLPSECIPKEILIKEIPHTSNGKKSRKGLPQ